ncbi:MAG: peptide chain release factor 2 [Chitinispirillales bacterium]|nr:peptide chain release factor 2 [Chitinispirillales bacterium]
MFDIENRQKKINILEKQTVVPNFWNDAISAQKILKAIKNEKDFVEPWQNLKSDYDSLEEMFDFAVSENDVKMLEQITQHFSETIKNIGKLEFVRKLSGEDDKCDAIITIHSGAGGTESCDWADMLFRMYSRWIERHKYKSLILDYCEGEEAGIKSVSIEVRGEYLYGHLKSEIGVHRLVRISPFDSNARRHTSFASVYAYPIFEEVNEYEIDEKDIRVDTYRSSGAGGQHINKTDSAVRMTHIPTNIVVQCQNERSQVKNRESCIKMLKARVRQYYKEEDEKKLADKLEGKKKIEWGSQIRSYVLHPYNMVKDLRTGYETSNTTAVLDGEIDDFIEKFLLEFS